MAIAGFLASHRDVLVLDEPYAGLDAAGPDALTKVLADLRPNGVTIVVVTHDHDGIELIADRRISLDNGRVVGDTAPRASRPPHADVNAADPPAHAAGSIHLFRVLPGPAPCTAACGHEARDARRARCHTRRISRMAHDRHRRGACRGRHRRGSHAASARPRLPRWFFVALLLSRVLNFIAGGPPNVHVLGSTIGMRRRPRLAPRHIGRGRAVRRGPARVVDDSVLRGPGRPRHPEQAVAADAAPGRRLAGTCTSRSVRCRP